MKYEFSAGGVVYKKDQDKLEILIAMHSGHHGWVFPKGIIGDQNEKETKEEAALREVTEETGITGEIKNALTPVTYWYVWEGEKKKKTVYYFLMEYISGETTNHDWEMEEVEWLPTEEIATRLTYKTDKQAWQEAKAMLEIE